jgi:hypothetical protein
MSLVDTSQSSRVLATISTTVQDAVSAIGLFITICVCIVALILIAGAMLSHE